MEGPWPLLLVCAFGAEILGTMAGFGAATILTPIAALFLDVKSAIAMVAWFHLFGNASRLLFFGRHIQWRVWLQFGLIGVLCSFLGAQLTALLPSATVTWLFGAFLLCYVGVAAARPQGVRLPRGPLTLVGGGIVSGLIAGLLGTGGAIRSACLLAFGLGRDAYLGTSAAIALIVDATRLPVYVGQQLLPRGWLPVALSLSLVAFAGSWVGQWLIRRVPAAAFRWFVMALLTLMGLKLFVDGWRGAA